jgi:hypothetical protein
MLEEGNISGFRKAPQSSVANNSPWGSRLVSSSWLLLLPPVMSHNCWLLAVLESSKPAEREAVCLKQLEL